MKTMQIPSGTVHAMPADLRKALMANEAALYPADPLVSGERCYIMPGYEGSFIGH